MITDLEGFAGRLGEAYFVLLFIDCFRLAVDQPLLNRFGYALSEGDRLRVHILLFLKDNQISWNSSLLSLKKEASSIESLGSKETECFSIAFMTAYLAFITGLIVSHVT